MKQLKQTINKPARPSLVSPRYISAMAYAFEGYATAEFKGGSYSCANGLPTDVIGYLPSFLPNTTALQVRSRALASTPAPRAMTAGGSRSVYVHGCWLQNAAVCRSVCAP